MKLIDLMREYFGEIKGYKTTSVIYVEQDFYDLLENHKKKIDAYGVYHKGFPKGDHWALSNDLKIVTPYGEFVIKPINDRVVELKSEKGDMTKFILKRLRSEVENLSGRVESLEMTRIYRKNQTSSQVSVCENGIYDKIAFVFIGTEDSCCRVQLGDEWRGKLVERIICGCTWCMFEFTDKTSEYIEDVIRMGS